MAERIVAADTDLALKPASLSHIEAASLPLVALTSLQSLKLNNVSTGHKVMVVGASGACGLLGIQLARALVGPHGKVAAICGTIL